MADIKKLKQLRDETGVSISLCKKALEEAGGDLKKAREILYKTGAERVTKKMSEITKEGAIFSYIHHNKKIASMIELLCQTDFVARTQEYQELGALLAMQIAFSNPKDIKAFLSEESIKIPGKTIETIVKEYILKLGENIKVSRLLRWEIGENE